MTFRETVYMPTVIRTDYAANAGSQDVNEFISGPFTRAEGMSPTYPWPSTAGLTGVSFQRSMILLAEIVDGTSSTFLVGEKYLNPDHYESGNDNADNECALSGFDNDNFRVTFSPPLRERRGLGDTKRFCSAHPSTVNMAFYDGSVHSVSYEIDGVVFRAMGSRNQGEAVSGL